MFGRTIAHYIVFIVAGFAALVVGGSSWAVGEVIARKAFDTSLPAPLGYGLIATLLFTNLMLLYFLRWRARLAAQGVLAKIFLARPSHMLLGLALLLLIARLKRSQRTRQGT